MKILWFLGTLFAGVTFGGLYFAGLWLTVHHLPKVNRPAVLGLVSLAVRGGLLLVGMLVIAGYGWEGLLGSLVGFLLVRMAWIHRLQPPAVARPGDLTG